MVKNFKQFIKESAELDKEIQEYWNKALKGVPESEIQKGKDRLTEDIINARKIADKFLSFISTKSEKEFNKWIDENPVDAFKMQEELEKHTHTKNLWQYGFDRKAIPYSCNTIEEFLYKYLTTDIEKIKNKYK